MKNITNPEQILKSEVIDHANLWTITSHAEDPHNHEKLNFEINLIALGSILKIHGITKKEKKNKSKDNSSYEKFIKLRTISDLNDLMSYCHNEYYAKLKFKEGFSKKGNRHYLVIAPIWIGLLINALNKLICTEINSVLKEEFSILAAENYYRLAIFYTQQDNMFIAFIYFVEAFKRAPQHYDLKTKSDNESFMYYFYHLIYNLTQSSLSQENKSLHYQADIVKKILLEDKLTFQESENPYCKKILNLITSDEQILHSLENFLGLSTELRNIHYLDDIINLLPPPQKEKAAIFQSHLVLDPAHPWPLLEIALLIKSAVELQTQANHPSNSQLSTLNIALKKIFEYLSELPHQEIVQIVLKERLQEAAAMAHEDKTLALDFLQKLKINHTEIAAIIEQQIKKLTSTEDASRSFTVLCDPSDLEKSTAFFKSNNIDHPALLSELYDKFVPHAVFALEIILKQNRFINDADREFARNFIPISWEILTDKNANVARINNNAVQTWAQFHLTKHPEAILKLCKLAAPENQQLNSKLRHLQIAAKILVNHKPFTSHTPLNSAADSLEIIELLENGLLKNSFSTDIDSIILCSSLLKYFTATPNEAVDSSYAQSKKIQNTLQAYFEAWQVKFLKNALDCLPLKIIREIYPKSESVITLILNANTDSALIVSIEQANLIQKLINSANAIPKNPDELDAALALSKLVFGADSAESLFKLHKSSSKLNAPLPGLSQSTEPTSLTLKEKLDNLLSGRMQISDMDNDTKGFIEQTVDIAGPLRSTKNIIKNHLPQTGEGENRHQLIYDTACKIFNEERISDENHNILLNNQNARKETLKNQNHAGEFASIIFLPLESFNQEAKHLDTLFLSTKISEENYYKALEISIRKHIYIARNFVDLLGTKYTILAPEIFNQSFKTQLHEELLTIQSQLHNESTNLLVTYGFDWANHEASRRYSKLIKKYKHNFLFLLAKFSQKISLKISVLENEELQKTLEKLRQEYVDNLYYFDHHDNDPKFNTYFAQAHKTQNEVAQFKAILLKKRFNLWQQKMEFLSQKYRTTVLHMLNHSIKLTDYELTSIPGINCEFVVFPHLGFALTLKDFIHSTHFPKDEANSPGIGQSALNYALISFSNHRFITPLQVMKSFILLLSLGSYATLFFLFLTQLPDLFQTAEVFDEPAFSFLFNATAISEQIEMIFGDLLAGTLKNLTESDNELKIHAQQLYKDNHSYYQQVNRNARLINGFFEWGLYILAGGLLFVMYLKLSAKISSYARLPEKIHVTTKKNISNEQKTLKWNGRAWPILRDDQLPLALGAEQKTEELTSNPSKFANSELDILCRLGTHVEGSYLESNQLQFLHRLNQRHTNSESDTYEPDPDQLPLMQPSSHHQSMSFFRSNRQQVSQSTENRINVSVQQETLVTHDYNENQPQDTVLTIDNGSNDDSQENDEKEIAAQITQEELAQGYESPQNN